MSMIKLMEEIPHMQGPYLYQRIIHYINQNLGKIELLKYNKDRELKIFEYLKKLFGGELNVLNSTVKDKINFFEDVISNLKYEKQHKKATILEILKNLIFSEKDKVMNFTDINIENINEKIFTLNDFILTYALKVIELFKNNKINEDEVSENSMNLYLYLIFQIKNSDLHLKLKFLVYSYLYEKKNSSNIKIFIFESSKLIVNKQIININDLLNLEKKYEEFDNIDIKNVSDNVAKFFSRNEEIKNYQNLFKNLKKEKVIQNLKKIEPKEIESNNIVVDDINFGKYNNKLYLFSPEFLILSGLKNEIEYCDLEMFNDDNYSVDSFSKYITQIIDEINKCIVNNYFLNDFMKNNLIQINVLKDQNKEQKFIHYISAKLDYHKKIELKETKKQIVKTKEFHKITIKGKNTMEQKESNKENSNEIIELLSKSKLSSSNCSSLEFQKEFSDYLEDLINQKLIEKVEKEKLINLPNILFMLNLKIPVYKEENNSIYFKSVHLDFFDDNKNHENDNYYYGCKEIDSIFKNNSLNYTHILDDIYFKTNLIYIKENNENFFKLKEENHFSIYSNSIFFYEFQKSFPNLENGKEKVILMKINDKTAGTLKDYTKVNENEPLKSYKE